uniref:Transmembrane protein n=1 Tax=Medicago truncatula TaxID=3880 RepID=I3S0D6_MEDTR|nr:unknown [Medicago truncatula]
MCAIILVSYIEDVCHSYCLSPCIQGYLIFVLFYFLLSTQVFDNFPV